MGIILWDDSGPLTQCIPGRDCDAKTAKQEQGECYECKDRDGEGYCVWYRKEYADHCSYPIWNKK